MEKTVSDEPFARKVTITLAQAIQATQKALSVVEATGDLSEFNNYYNKGVSANLCLALAELNVSDDLEGIELGFSWSPTRSLPQKSPVISRFQFSPTSLMILSEVAKELKDKSNCDDFTLRGVVTGLQKPHGANAGQITVYGPIEDAMRNVIITLDEERYKMAIQARERGIFISCVGELERQKRPYHLSNPRQFHLLRQ